MIDDRTRFFRQWWQAAFSPAWRHGRNASFVVTVVGGAVAYLNPDLHKALALAAWLAPLSVLLAIALYRLAMAPYEIYRLNRVRIMVVTGVRLAPGLWPRLDGE
jgi:hypothetical protein